MSYQVQFNESSTVKTGSIVEAKGLVKVYTRGNEEIRALAGIDIEIKEGEFVCLLGPSGAGKTTALNLFGLMDRPTSGSLSVAGYHISSDSERVLSENKLDEIRRKNIGFIFQQFYLMSTLSATENVEMPLIWSGEPANGRGKALLERVGLSHRLTHKPTELSGGEQQRVAVARALVNNPKLLLADEPTGNLDTRTRDAIFDLFRELNREGLAIVFATHDIELAGRVDRVIRLHEGHIVE